MWKKRDPLEPVPISVASSVPSEIPEWAVGVPVETCRVLLHSEYRPGEGFTDFFCDEVAVGRKLVMEGWEVPMCGEHMRLFSLDNDG